MVYIVEGPKYSHKRNQNQLQKRRFNPTTYHKEKKSQ